MSRTLDSQTQDSRLFQDLRITFAALMEKMELPKRYEAKEIEGKWYQYWLDNSYFRSVPDEREPYTVVIPPPNVTGVLHMGHTVSYTHLTLPTSDLV